MCSHRAGLWQGLHRARRKSSWLAQSLPRPCRWLLTGPFAASRPQGCCQVRSELCVTGCSPWLWGGEILHCLCPILSLSLLKQPGREESQARGRGRWQLDDLWGRMVEQSPAPAQGSRALGSEESRVAETFNPFSISGVSHMSKAELCREAGGTQAQPSWAGVLPLASGGVRGLVAGFMPW